MFKQKKTKHWTSSDHGLNSIKDRFNSKTVFILFYYYFFFFGGGGDFLKNNPRATPLKNDDLWDRCIRSQPNSKYSVTQKYDS